MTGDADLIKWCPAWCVHDRQLHAQFATWPFLMDPNSTTYVQQFERAHVNMLADTSPHTNCLSRNDTSHPPFPPQQSSAHYLPYDRSNRNSHTSDSFHPSLE